MTTAKKAPAKKGLTEDEKWAVGELNIIMLNDKSLLFSLSDAWIYTETAELDDEFFVRSLDAIRSVTSEEIRTLAQRYFCKEKLIEVVAGKKV